MLVIIRLSYRNRLKFVLFRPIASQEAVHRIGDRSQAQLAELLSISRQTVIAIEQSKTDPSVSTAMRVAWLFPKPIESIFLADIDEQMVALNETWEYKKKTATALNESMCLNEWAKKAGR